MALYFDRVCADSPTVLRACRPGETGVVVARYGGVAEADWIAVPLIPYLYAVERAADVPGSADPQRVTALRDEYRQAHFRALVPDAPGGQVPKGNWIQLIGAAYNREIIAFTVATTAEQDERLVRTLNGRPNKSRFNFFLRNCADFARDVLNLYFPKAVKNNLVADLGLTTPKQVTKCLVRYCGRHPELELRTFVVSQIPGSQKKTGNPRGVLESLSRKAMYVVPLALVQPWIPVACVSGYLVAGRFDTRPNTAEVYAPTAVERWAAEGRRTRDVRALSAGTSSQKPQ